MAQGYQTPISPDGFKELLAAVKATREQVGGLNADVKDLNRAVKDTGGSAKTLGGRNVSDTGLGKDFIGPKPATASQIARQLKTDEREERRVREKFMTSWDKRASEVYMPKTQNEKVREMIMTSRILGDGSLSPIMGKALAAGFGPVSRFGGAGGSLLASAAGGAIAQGGTGLVAKGISSALGYGAGSAAAGETAFLVAAAASAAIPFIIAGAAGAAAITAGIGFIEGGAGRIATGSAAYWQSGGSPTELGQALGLGGDNAGSKAEALGTRLRGGGYAAAVARAHGITDLGDYFTPDKTANYVKSLDLLHGTKDPIEKMRLARGLGLQEDAWTSDLDDSTYQRLKASRGEYSEAGRKSEARYRGNKEIFGNKIDKWWRDNSEAPMNAASEALGGNIFPLLGQVGSQLARMSGPGLIYRAFSAEYGFVRDHLFGNKGSDEAKSTNNPGASMPQVRNRVIKDGPDWVNGTARSTGAVPPGIVAQQLDNQFNFDNLNLGGISAAPQ